MRHPSLMEGLDFSASTNQDEIEANTRLAEQNSLVFFLEHGHYDTSAPDVVVTQRGVPVVRQESASKNVVAALMKVGWFSNEGNAGKRSGNAASKRWGNVASNMRSIGEKSAEYGLNSSNSSVGPGGGGGGGGGGDVTGFNEFKRTATILRMTKETILDDADGNTARRGDLMARLEADKVGRTPRKKKAKKKKQKKPDQTEAPSIHDDFSPDEIARGLLKMSKSEARDVDAASPGASSMAEEDFGFPEGAEAEEEEEEEESNMGFGNLADDNE